MVIGITEVLKPVTQIRMNFLAKMLSGTKQNHSSRWIKCSILISRIISIENHGSRLIAEITFYEKIKSRFTGGGEGEGNLRLTKIPFTTFIVINHGIYCRGLERSSERSLEQGYQFLSARKTADNESEEVFYSPQSSLSLISQDQRSLFGGESEEEVFELRKQRLLSRWATEIKTRVLSTAIHGWHGCIH